ncbi:conserved hypothetical protein [Leishmania infantum JPCM5]|uniref:Uncharacterized protein n=2 Tax=Leishmania infantum TaxID=5671 RepID=A4HXZ2_LEIIN|nr:conserved hypothetical protein [Leishmania infantum JPCM5]CAM67172.1 conserved hypothetical protein [Leishmania infantum JPCM5]|eukprot:XP_001464933.1 conserved hypothetical protein [Leishmania infantum JPCM5]
MAGEISERGPKSTAALLRNPQGAPLVRAAATHAPPKLMRPASTAAQQRPTSGFSPVGGSSLPATASSSVSFAHTATSTPPIRGIPLFTKTQRPAGWASVSPLSSASSLRLSLEEYGRAQLQDEAVLWYHRCSELEQQLTNMQDAFNRQSRLLAAQWRADGSSGVCAKSSADVTRASSVKASSAEATARSPSGRDATLTSRSPDTLLRAYAYAETEDGYYAGQTERPLQRVGSEDFQHCPSEGRKRMRVDDRAPSRGPVLGQMAEGEMQCRVPKAYPVTAEDEDAVQDLPKHDFGSQVHRGPRGADGTAASSSPPLSRVSGGLQTDGLASGNASFARETRGIPVEGLLSAFTEATREDPSCLPSTPGPSVIMSKQYVAAMEEIEMLRARVDVAERKSAELHEMCAAHELRCDELETQLLGKEEQLLRSEQRPATPAEAAAKALLSELNPLIAQLQDLLTLVHPDSQGAPRQLGALAAEAAGTVQAAATGNLFSATFEDLAAEGDVAARCSTNSCPKSPYAEASTHLGVAHLTSLVTQVRSAIADLSQRFAALQAELDVVRADRNELIGEQSEQVRLLQEQLLKKDTAQWRLLEDLHRAQEQLAVARAQTPVAPADGEMGSSEPTASRHPQKLGGHSEEDATATASGSAAQLSSFPVCEAVADATQRLSPQQANSATHPTQSADTSAAEVAALQEQLAQVRAAAAAGQEAQRRVLSERLEQAELQLKEARLRAEDEYDRMSGTIEALTRELADTKEALRVKEMSLRIALRESFSPPLLITAQGDKAMSDNVVAGAPVAESLIQAAASSTLPSSMQLLRTMSRGSAASSSSPRPDRENTRTSMSPSPPIPPHLQSAAGMAKARDVADTDKGDGLLGFASGKKRKAHRRIEDDGTLRTLPSAIVVNGQDSEEGLGHTGQLFFSSAAALTTAITATATTTSSSREKSSRGLTMSTGGGSQGASSLPHGCGDGSAAMLEHVSIAEEAAPQEEMPTPLRQRSGAAAPLFTQEEEAATVAFEAHRTISSSPPQLPQRKSAPALLADTAAKEELPLPPPLRSPLFGTATLSGPPSPVQQQRTPSPHRHETTYGARLGIYASASQGRAEQYGPHDRFSELSAQPLSPEEKLRKFLSTLSASPSPLEAMMKESGRSLLTGQTTRTRRPTLHNSSDAIAASSDAIPSDVMVAALSTAGTRSVPMMDRDETTPGRRPLSLYSASASPSSASRSTASRPSPTLLSSSPHSAEVAARHVQASLWRHREAWQQQELILHALQKSPSR